MPEETLLAFDFGLRRIGVAAGQQITGTASPVTTLICGDKGINWQTIDALIKEWQPQRLLVGQPLHADGEASDISTLAMQFARELERYQLPVETIDERHTSLEAAEHLKSARQRGAKRHDKTLLDAVAAVLIAERWLKKREQSE